MRMEMALCIFCSGNQLRFLMFETSCLCCSDSTTKFSTNLSWLAFFFLFF